MKFGFVALLSLSAVAAVNGGIHDIIQEEKRFVVFNSRRLTGECCKFLAKNVAMLLPLLLLSLHETIRLGGAGLSLTNVVACRCLPIRNPLLAANVLIKVAIA